MKRWTFENSDEYRAVRSKAAWLSLSTLFLCFSSVAGAQNGDDDYIKCEPETRAPGCVDAQITCTFRKEAVLTGGCPKGNNYRDDEGNCYQEGEKKGDLSYRWCKTEDKPKKDEPNKVNPKFMRLAAKCNEHLSKPEMPCPVGAIPNTPTYCMQRAKYEANAATGNGFKCELKEGEDNVYILEGSLSCSYQCVSVALPVAATIEVNDSPQVSSLGASFEEER